MKHTDMYKKHSVTITNNGDIVIPADAREGAGLAEGEHIVLLETTGGLVLLTRKQLRTRVREDLSGQDLVTSLLKDRRKAAAREDEV